MAEENMSIHKSYEEKKIGEVQIADDVVAVIAGLAATEVEGVDSMAGNITNELVGKLGMKNLSKGVKVSQSSGRIEIDVNIIARYGCKIPQVAWDIQENVKTEVKEITDLKVNAVNIHVQGVEKDDQK